MTDDDWMRRLNPVAPPLSFELRRRQHMLPGESTRQARDRWRAEAGRCRDCGSASGDRAECDPCRAGRRKRERQSRR